METPQPTSSKRRASPTPRPHAQSARRTQHQPQIDQIGQEDGDEKDAQDRRATLKKRPNFFDKRMITVTYNRSPTKKKGAQ